MTMKENRKAGAENHGKFEFFPAPERVEFSLPLTAVVTGRDIAEAGTRIWSTDECSEITVESGGEAMFYHPHL